uniref:Uncharacterized protein n=1 Tax=Tanacetum cinerariifolium TaxID=118510 RepID=A0A6L2MLG4_TANCI|nr:hypothetical protein [Tanacetum cinerariifolium]
MNVMHTYYAKESHIQPPVIVLPSPMLSPMFNPQEFFLPEELFPPKKQGHDRSSSSISAQPQEFKIEESSHKTSFKRHEEQIEEILNYLDELSLDRIKNIEGLGKVEVCGKDEIRFKVNRHRLKSIMGWCRTHEGNSLLYDDVDPPSLQAKKSIIQLGL